MKTEIPAVTDSGKAPSVNIDALTMEDVRNAKEKRGGVSTIDFVLAQVGSVERLEAAKQYLRKIGA